MGLFGHQIFSNVPGMSEWAHNARGPGPQDPSGSTGGKAYTDCIAIVVEGYGVYIYIHKYTYVYTHSDHCVDCGKNISMIVLYMHYWHLISMKTYYITSY